MANFEWLKNYEHFKIVEVADHTIELKYKNIIIDRYSQLGVTEDTLRNRVEELNNNVGLLERMINDKN